jgi:hypothetical protein
MKLFFVFICEAFKDISKNEIISQVYPFGSLHISYVFKAKQVYKFIFIFNKFTYFFKIVFSDFAFKVL